MVSAPPPADPAPAGQLGRRDCPLIMRTPHTPLKSWLAAAVGLTTTALAAGGLGLATAAPAEAAGPAFPAHFAAPYLQIASSDAGDMAADMAASGDKFY